MKHIALIGAEGFVGKALFSELSKDPSLKIAKVVRRNYSYWKKQDFDIVINAAMPAARFWAMNHPAEDFVETVVKTADIVNKWNYKKFIQISTVSARTELGSVYGRHKKAAEDICNFGDNLIIRLTSMYGPTLTKGALIDMLAGRKVFVSEKSSYGFASLDFVCEWIHHNLDNKGLVEVGAKNSLSLGEIAKHFHWKIIFEGRVDIQKVENPLPQFPDARDVLVFLEKRIKNHK